MKKILLPIIRRVLPPMSFFHTDLEEEALAKEYKKKIKKKEEEEGKELKETLEELSTKFGEDE